MIVHLAGSNRPNDVSEFDLVNVDLTKSLCGFVANSRRRIPLIFTSSSQADLGNPYGVSKQKAEEALKQLAYEANNPVVIYRLPGIFGKWCKPNYNSVVATFCHNIANGIPIKIDHPDTKIRLVYVDDFVSSIIENIKSPFEGVSYVDITPEYLTTVGSLAEQIYLFKESRDTLVSEPVGKGLIRALYSTYLSYLPKHDFVYDINCHRDERGVFVEMLKTINTGQFSFFTAKPGVERGGHYHHSKTEKFLVISGNAHFRFRDIQNNDTHEIHVSGDKPQIVETVPGWSHSVTNVGNDDLLVMLWANEIFDPDKPDTINSDV